MRDTKWTPGPWHPGHMTDPSTPCNCRGIVDEGRYAGGIATVLKHNGITLVSEGGNDCPPEEEAIANAHLIAAAPELYEALALLTDVARIRAGNVDKVFAEPLAKAEAALSRARGEAS